MQKIGLCLLVAGMLPFGASAQLSKLMSKYHEQNCVTVTQLDKNLYGLYQKENLPSEVSEMLQKLDEVNILNLNLNSCDASFSDRVIAQFREALNKPDRYKLIKSRNDQGGKQLIYTRDKEGQISDLVVWNQGPERLDIIELRGDIRLDKIALLSRALNIKGLNSLAALSSNSDSYQEYKHEQSFDADQLSKYMEQVHEMMRRQFGKDWGGSLRSRDGSAEDSGQAEHFFDIFDESDFLNFFSAPGKIDSLVGFFDWNTMRPEQLDDLFENGKMQQKVEKYFQSFGDGENVMSNSVQITEENGKTKIKIDSKNSDMTYVIDGQQAPQDNLQMPEGILNVNIIPSKEDIKKSYLFITSKDKLGEFISFSQGVLTFKYKNQEYRYNVDKVQEPILVIDGRLSTDFDIEPTDILQIRPISQIEKEVGYYPNAEVIINTK